MTDPRPNKPPETISESLLATLAADLDAGRRRPPTPPAASGPSTEPDGGAVETHSGTHWTRNLLELGAIFGAIAALEFWIGDGTGFMHVQPHPYWIVVLLAAAGRGVVAAMIAATFAAGLYALEVVGAGRAAGVVELLDLDLMFEPVLFFGIGYLIGELRDGLAHRNRQLERQVDKLARATTRSEGERQLLESANRELRRRLFDNAADFDTLINAVTHIESVTETGLFELPLGMVEDRCGATKCSVLLVMPDGSVDLARHRGWTTDEIRDRIEQANASLFVRRAIAEAVPIHCFHRDAAMPTSGPLLVSPVIDATGVVKALLCLDEIPPRRFHDSTVHTFVTIADWLGASLRRVDDHQLPKGLRETVQKIVRGSSWVGRPEDFGERLQIEDARAARQGLRAALLTLHAVDLDPRAAGVLEQMDRFLIDNLCKGLHPADDVYRFGYPGYYVFVLPGTSREDADKVRQRFEAKLATLDTASFGRIDLALFRPESDEDKLVDLLAQLTSNYYANHDMPAEPRCPVPLPGLARHGDAVDFARRLRIELGVARRFGQDLSILDFRGTNDDVDVGQMVARHLSNLPSSVLRASDGIFVLDQSRCVVLMANTDCLSASQVWQRLQAKLRSTIPEDRFHQIETDFLALDGSEAQLLVDYFLGEEDVSEPGKLLSEQELEQLEFTMSELDRITRLGPFSEDAAVDGTPEDPVPLGLELPADDRLQASIDLLRSELEGLQGQVGSTSTQRIQEHIVELVRLCMGITRTG